MIAGISNNDELVESIMEFSQKVLMLCYVCCFSEAH